MLLWGIGVVLVSRLGESRLFYRLRGVSVVCAALLFPAGLYLDDPFVVVFSWLPLAFILWYQLCRRYYRNRYGDEPYITSGASVSGSPVNPFDYLGKARAVRGADFAFTLGVLGPPILIAIALVELLRETSPAV